MTEILTGTDWEGTTIVEPGIDAPYEDTDDPLHRTHIVNEYDNGHIWKPGMNAQDVVDTARKRGYEVIALCGYKFVPKANPDKYEACDPCIKVAGAIMRSDG